MTHIAILGFGVVGSGTARLITDNEKEIINLVKDEINIKYILDLRDFPDSPFSDKIVHDFGIILGDSEVSVIIEVMGGSHPAYEYTVAALREGKSVITSNKEVVANYGDEFLSIAKEMGVCYRFEAAVGGGIPVISPIISCIRHNKISEVRGILNGTTNYILTQMFSYGRSFSSALADAQQKGYAERNPDADILGVDACRKITILAALASGRLASPDAIYTEGITGIRDADVNAASKIGATIKLVGRAILSQDKPFAIVAPFIVSSDMPLAEVNGVYNAVEVIAAPLGNVMFYGQGAGAGATASAVVSDLVEIVTAGTAYPAPVFEKCSEFAPVSNFSSKHYLAFTNADYDKCKESLGSATLITTGDEVSLITHEMAESELWKTLENAGVKPLSHIRVLK